MMSGDMHVIFSGAVAPEIYWFSGSIQDLDRDARGFFRSTAAVEVRLLSRKGEELWSLSNPAPRQKTREEKAARESARRDRQLARAAACQAARGKTGEVGPRFGAGKKKQK